MNFAESIEYLFGLGYELSVKKFGLENTYALLQALENPQKKLLKIQIAGTNGKGSTCAFLGSICIKAGLKVGLNTSPHLVSVTERIRVNGEDISEVRFAEYVTRLRAISQSLVESGKLEGMPTFFEHITAIALCYFADEGVEIAILEAGLGGRFDATTAAEAEIVAITPIDLDHTKTLGDTIEKIAAEKAAIIREGVKAVIGVQKDEAMRVIIDKCAEVNVVPRFADRISIESGRYEHQKPQPPRPSDTLPLKGGEFEMNDSNAEKKLGRNTTARECAENAKSYVNFKTENADYENIVLSLKGKHQIENAKTAILLAEILMAQGFKIEKEHIERGLERAVHKGRLEFSDGILFDGAHNVSGTQALREYIVENIASPITMVFAAMGGKNLDEISEILFPLAENIIFATPENPRARAAKEIAEFVPKNFDQSRVFVIDESAEALKKAREICEGGLILVTGSLYLIGEIKAHLKNRKVERRKKKKV